MEKEKTLSEKKFMCAMPSGWKEVNETKDVKEALKRLKEEFCMCDTVKKLTPIECVYCRKYRNIFGEELSK